MPNKMRGFFLVVGYGTLIVDVYLVLASVAAKMMKAQYSRYLPPFGSEGGVETITRQPNF